MTNGSLPPLPENDSHRVSTETVSDLLFEFAWDSLAASHRDRVLAPRFNLWRDCLPPALQSLLTGAAAGEKVGAEFGPGEIVPENDLSLVNALPLAGVDRDRLAALGTSLAQGRFYPQGILNGLAGVFPQNIAPFRLIRMDEKGIVADRNHPLSRVAVTVTATPRSVRVKDMKKGGSCRALEDILGTGPGMQARAYGQPTLFFGEGAFDRKDPSDDAVFYQSPRMVHHLDATARGIIAGLYDEILPENARVLDLMTSWESHLPQDKSFAEVTGLGMNAEEMAANPRLTRTIIHDLNHNPTLPFPDNAFDAVVCTASVEYLTRPFEVFADLLRVLAPGGTLAMTFSNRWFPPKTIRAWEELHEFERLGLVSEYFLQTPGFTALKTLSTQGFPRPQDDKYADQFPFSDPVFAAWARKTA